MINNCIAMLTMELVFSLTELNTVCVSGRKPVGLIQALKSQHIAETWERGDEEIEKNYLSNSVTDSMAVHWLMCDNIICVLIRSCPLTRWCVTYDRSLSETVCGPDTALVWLGQHQYLSNRTLLSRLCGVHKCSWYLSYMSMADMLYLCYLLM